MKYILILLVIYLYGCTGKTPMMQNPDDLPVIDIEKAIKDNQTFYLSDIAESIEYIQLEFKKECTLKDIGRIYITAKDIFIASRGGVIFRFDRTGKFLNQIGKFGKGPGEYTTTRFFAVDSVQRRVYVNSDMIGIFVYDYDGKHIRTERSQDEYSWGFYALGNTGELVHIGSSFGYRDPGNYFFKISDTLANVRYIQKSLLTDMLKDGQQCFWSYGSLQNGDSLLLLDGISDTIFYYHQSKLNPYLVMDYGKYKITLDALLATVHDVESGLFLKPFILGTTPRYLFLEFRYTNNIGSSWDTYYILRYDKLTKECKAQKQLKKIGIHFENDLDGGMPIDMSFSSLNALNQWVMGYEAYDIMEKLTPEYLSGSPAKDPDAKQKMIKMVEQLTENDNPVIMVMKLK